MAQSVVEVIDAALVDRISAAEPQWLRDQRAAAWRTYESLPAPSDRSPGWRRLDFDAQRWSLPAPANGSTRAATHSQYSRNDRVVVAPLSEAVKTHPALVREALGTEQRPLSLGKYAALAAALWQDGTFVYIPDGLSPSEPIIIDADAAAYQRIVIVAGAGTQATVLERHRGGPATSIVVSDILVGDAAQLRYAHAQESSAEATYFSLQRARVARDAKLITLNFATGGALAKCDVEVELQAAGAESDMLGLVFGEGKQQFDFHTLQGHRSPNTRSDLLFKSALDDRSHSLYTGVIIIDKGAQRSDAYQANRNLILSDGARADTEPMLEIQADDVRCTHGATVGPLDEETLFYVESRGLSPDDGARIIVDGFFAEVFEKFGDARVTAELAAKVSPHLGRVSAQ